ncbi:alpha 1,2-mannosyltransferase 2.4.1 [Podila horticola]|nr:alpha 1,2-mannosyltransferase 2.4.1 [Podila horticola]
MRQIKYFRTGCPQWELDIITATIRTLEERFNYKYRYPYAFLIDQKFTQHFMSQVALFTPSSVEFDAIPTEHWSVHNWIDINRMWEEMNKQKEQGVFHGASLSYRHMCRFNSEFFYRQKIMQKYDYYWLVQSDVDYYCNMDDPFRTLRETGGVYGKEPSRPL